MMRSLSIVFFTHLVVCQYSFATSFVWMSAKAFLEQSDLIAIVDVSPIHEVTTPEGFRLQTASAKIIKEIYRRFPPLSGTEQKDLIVIYSLDVNAIVADHNIGVKENAFPIHEGKAFVCLKNKGLNKFYPYEPLCFQSMNVSEMITWPSEPVFRAGMEPYSQIPLSTVIQQINELQRQK